MAGTLPRRLRLTLGQSAERRAERFLRSQGLELVTRNFRCRFGELDLVMREDDCLVIAEVRFRKTGAFVAPALTVDEGKQAKIISATRCFLVEQPTLADYAIRFDVVAIEGPQQDTGTIQWIRDAFRV